MKTNFSSVMTDSERYIHNYLYR